MSSSGKLKEQTDLEICHAGLTWAIIRTLLSLDKEFVVNMSIWSRGKECLNLNVSVSTLDRFVKVRIQDLRFCLFDRALITLPKADNDLFMFFASRRRSPLAAVFPTRSEP